MDFRKLVLRSAVQIGILFVGAIIIVALNEITRGWWVIS